MASDDRVRHPRSERSDFGEHALPPGRIQPLGIIGLTVVIRINGNGIPPHILVEPTDAGEEVVEETAVRAEVAFQKPLTGKSRLELSHFGARQVQPPGARPYLDTLPVCVMEPVAVGHLTQFGAGPTPPPPAAPVFSESAAECLSCEQASSTDGNRVTSLTVMGSRSFWRGSDHRMEPRTASGFRVARQVRGALRGRQSLRGGCRLDIRSWVNLDGNVGEIGLARQ